MIILGVDPGSHATGFGVIATGPVVRMLAGGVIRTNAKAPLPERLLYIHRELADVIAAHAVHQLSSLRCGVQKVPFTAAKWFNRDADTTIDKCLHDATQAISGGFHCLIGGL